MQLACRQTGRDVVDDGNLAMKWLAVSAFALTRRRPLSDVVVVVVVVVRLGRFVFAVEELTETFCHNHYHHHHQLG